MLIPSYLLRKPPFFASTLPWVCSNRISTMAKPVCSKFVPLDNYEGVMNTSDGFKFTFISYNILAQVYVKSSYFPHSPSSCLKWKARSESALTDLKNLNADFFCIQELDEYNSFYKSKMETLGYSSLYIKRVGKKRDGCGIFYKPSSAQLLEMEEIDYNDLANCVNTVSAIRNNKVLDLEEKDAQIQDSEKQQSNDPLVRLKRDCVGLLAAFKLNDPSGHIIVVADTHIYWDPNWIDVKLAQAKYLLSRLSQFKELVSTKFTCTPSVLVAGDFNSTPGDEVYQYIVSTSEAAPIKLSSLYATNGGEPPFTNCTPDFTGTLDYIFFSGCRLKPVSLLEVPGRDSPDIVGGLPNYHHPSDHLPIGAEFLVLHSS
ncbi:carbon catabolite repressor protein 4 homolog 4-like isoform X1 [Zingiber officinale]|uniref:carbon catabolite repressor protein 4 homolog 4-like isoform X1 n=1 Tax=Zingiber officinale TaxID=94328 RepID=UPI001C4C0AC4|nr:carbon catabolite repressor protein 4 homolog 4-like isoform X1 [Zingiber officinale]